MLRITGGTVYDPANNLNGVVKDIGIADGRIASTVEGGRTIDARGMVVTPGKVGEWLKCYLLRELHGTPFSRSAPIVIAERLTDSLGLVILGAAGLVVFGDAWPAFVVVILGGALMFVVARPLPQ